jgi:hypothetical protein
VTPVARSARRARRTWSRAEMSRAQVPIQPPPWGPRRDPHFEATHNFEAYGTHTQVLQAEAALLGWYYRSEWYKQLVPDTRRCRCHGIVMYEPLPLEGPNPLYVDQRRGMATGPIG